MNALDRCFVTVSTSRRKPIGSGMLIAPNLILTCAHVYDDAISDSDSSDEFVNVSFIRLKDKSPRPAVLLRKATGEYDRRKTETFTSDLAVLELKDSLPVDAHSSSLISLSNFDHLTFEAFAATETEDFKHGGTADGRIRANIENRLVELKPDPRVKEGLFIRGGFSGGPVWLSGRGGAFGLITARLDKLPVAYAIPADCIREAFEDSGVLIPVRYPEHEEIESERKEYQRILDKVISDNSTVRFFAKTRPMKEGYQAVPLLRRLTEEEKEELRANIDTEFKNESETERTKRKKGISEYDEKNPIKPDEIREPGLKFVLADPGEGKTTLLSNLANRWGVNESQQWRSNRKCRPVIPILVSLPNLNHWWQHLPENSDGALPLEPHRFIEYIVDYAIPKSFAPNAAPSSESIRSCFVMGGDDQAVPVFLFDSLDELPAGHSSYVELCEKLSQYSCVIVTCRFLDFQKFRRKYEHQPIYRLQSFRRDQIVDFVRGYPYGAPDQLEELLQKILNRGIDWDMARVPMLLNLVCYAGSDADVSVDTRAEILEKALEKLLDVEEEDHSKRQVKWPGKPPHVERAYDHAAFLAWFVHVRNPGQNLCERCDLDKCGLLAGQWRLALENQSGSPEKPVTIDGYPKDPVFAEAFESFLRRRFVLNGNRTNISFSHRLLLEFLAARGLALFIERLGFNWDQPLPGTENLPPVNVVEFSLPDNSTVGEKAASADPE